MSEGLKDGGETPVLSPVIITHPEPEDSGDRHDVRVEIDWRGGGKECGKEHLFNRLLTGTKSEDPLLSLPHDFQVETGLYDEKELCHFFSEKKLATSASIAQMVASKFHAASDPAAVPVPLPPPPPSSGYGTIDGSKFTSTEGGDISADYLARKLRDVDDIDFTHDEEDAINFNTPNRSDLVLHNISANQDQYRVNQDHHTQLPSLLLTPPEPQSDSALCSSLTLVSSPTGLATVNPLTLTSSASTGDLSCVGSHYQDREGYLHMSPASTVTPASSSPPFSHKSSLDTLSQSP